jgi:hypothetical protein
LYSFSLSQLALFSVAYFLERDKLLQYSQLLAASRLPNEIEIDAEQCAHEWRTQHVQVMFAQKCYDQRKRARLAEENNEV